MRKKAFKISLIELKLERVEIFLLIFVYISSSSSSIIIII